MLPKLEKEVLDWEQKFKSLTAIDDLKKKIDRLKEDMAWAFVSEKEKVIIKGRFVYSLNNFVEHLIHVSCNYHSISRKG